MAFVLNSGIPFTRLENPAIYGGDHRSISIPYRKGRVKALSILTGFTLSASLFRWEKEQKVPASLTPLSQVEW
jgi:hypothetical protein